MSMYYLKPQGAQKSFCNKAVVICDDTTGNHTLYSYSTPIITMYPDGNLKKLWDGWTRTTGKHINAFCGLNKQEFMALTMED